MQLDNFLSLLLIIGFASTLFYGMYRVSRFAFIINLLILGLSILYLSKENELIQILLYLVCPIMLINIGLYVFLHKTDKPKTDQCEVSGKFCDH